MKLSWLPSPTYLSKQKRELSLSSMEVDLTTPDDPHESQVHSQNDDASLEHTLFFELEHHIEETVYSSDQIEAPLEELSTENLHSDGKSPRRSSCQMQGAIFSGKILSFCCSECKDNSTYSPNDLLKHFQSEHKGTLPTYPCDLCLFVTNEFSTLQRHRIQHKNTWVTCEICKDGKQYSLLLLTRHFTNCHSSNGQFECKKCDFSTRDAGTFVQHIHHHNKHNWLKYGSPTQDELPKYNMEHSGSFLCPFCGFIAAHRENLNRHLTTVHSEETNKSNEDSGVISPGLKLLLKKSTPVRGSREPQWKSKFNPLAGVALMDHNGRTIEDRTAVAIKENNKCKKSLVKSEQHTLQLIPSAAQPKLQENELSPGALSSCNSNGLTVLMVKNKISIPPNCTTKVMGFKIKDGKKHLVLKVVPAKQANSFGDDVLESQIAEDDDKTTSSTWSSSSPSMGSLLSLESGESNEASLIKEQLPQVTNHICQNDELKVSKEDLSQAVHEETEITPTELKNSALMNESSGLKMPAEENTHQDWTKVYSENSADEETAVNACRPQKSKTVKSKSSKCKIIRSETDEWQDPESDKAGTSLSEMGDIIDSSEISKTKDKITVMVLNNETAKDASKTFRDPLTEVEINFLNSPRQEVFSFHNYSKETSGSSPESMFPEEDTTRDLEEEECEEDFGDWSLTLPASPSFPSDEESKGITESNLASESGEKTLERVSDSDIEVDECIATVDDSLVSMLPEKDESDFSPENKQEGEITENSIANVSNASVLGKILEKHSDAIITQQLEKERMMSPSAVQEPARPTKTTLRILQTPEGRQQMFLQTKDKPYAVPVQLTSGAGFKLITKTSSPQINVSYVKPGIDPACKSKGVALTLNGGRIGMSAHSMENKGQTSIPTMQSGSGKRYFVSSSALKTSLLVSPGSVKSSSGEQVTNMPQTCYLLQTPVSEATETTLTNPKTVLATRPVLAMPVNSGDKNRPSQSGRQAYLVRYVSQTKSGIILNNSSGKAFIQGNQVKEAGKNRVFLKIVRGPNGTSFLSSLSNSADKKPIYLATSSLQSHCLLTYSNKSLDNVSTGFRTLSSQVNSQKLISKSQLKHIPPHSTPVKSRADHKTATLKPSLLSVSTRPEIQRKRRRRALLADFEERSLKVRKCLSKSAPEKDTTSIWEPVAKDVARRLRLCPFSPLQEIKCPRRNQPVVVLNHPDADIPEVAAIMRCVNKYKGDVLKVALSQSTLAAFSESLNTSFGSEDKRSRSAGGNIRERFILKLKLKKTNRNKYKVVKSSTTGLEQQTKFHCWFCGRVFNDQEAWIGHGQRHLMEATRDWNKLY